MGGDVVRDDTGNGGEADAPEVVPPAGEAEPGVERNAADEMEAPRENPIVDPGPNEAEAVQDAPAAPGPNDPNGGNEHEESILQRLRHNRAAQIVAAAGVGAIAAPLLLTAGFYAIGLSTAGPIAGGWFAANMGSGLVAGSAMSTLQSAAMTAATYTSAAWFGSGAGTVVGVVATGQKEEGAAERERRDGGDQENNDGEQQEGTEEWKEEVEEEKEEEEKEEEEKKEGNP